MATLKNYPFSLDLVSDSLTPLILSRVTEKKSTTLVVEIFNNGDTIDDFDAYTPVFECALPGGKFVRDDGSTYGNMQKVGGKIVYTIAKEVFSTQGILNLCYFALEKGGTPGFQILDSLDLTADERVTTQNFTISVSKDATQGNIVVEDFISDIDKLTNFIEAETAQSMAALNIALTKLDVATASANELIALINANAVVKIADTTNWQKGVKITTDSGVSKAILSGVTDWNNFLESGYFSIYGPNMTANKPPAGTYLDVEIHKRSGDTGKQIATDIQTGKSYTRALMSGGVWTAWQESETTAGAQIKADAAKNAAIAYVNTKFADTGWIPLTLKAGFTAFANSVPRYRKIGNEVSYAGIVVRTSGGTGVFATIEDGYRQKDTYPQSHLVGQQTSAADAQAQIYTHSNGNLEIVSAVYASPIWLNEISYFTD
ncbi:BppU family phage baseplate upper protein [Listeria booriae]|uniref:BppU family phage baseplate upper protein n=1 Tax=Listeria booriae TaxID=1552123 RepID=UPI00162A7809|nr:BppU family phage baseplate upper protein [Listeria booriae]MBC2100641.1 BppU family phage baseplate upper protein [Listeria booriae]